MSVIAKRRIIQQRKLMTHQQDQNILQRKGITPLLKNGIIIIKRVSANKVNSRWFSLIHFYKSSWRRIIYLLCYVGWKDLFPKCGELNSSPIEIDLDREEPFKALNQTVRFINYDASIGLIAENTGHGGTWLFNQFHVFDRIYMYRGNICARIT